MLDNTIKELILATSVKLGISQFAVEKDVYVTKAISVVNSVSHEQFDLVFQGGTCLAKAHQIIHRMSEDCDFRIRSKTKEPGKSKEIKRKTLRDFRRKLITVLKENEFNIDDGDLHVRNEGQFMSVRASYSSLFSPEVSMKPYLALEFFLGDVNLPIEIKPVSTLIQQTLKTDVSHPSVFVNSMSIIETAAEKWVALTRRVSLSKHHQHYHNTNLVRHIYDLYKIRQQGLFSDKFKNLVPIVVEKDRYQFKNHGKDYYVNPVKEIKQTVDSLTQASYWQDNWDQFISTMVFDTHKPSFHMALTNLHEISEEAIAVLSKFNFSEI
jgi:hypothetical protein